MASSPAPDDSTALILPSESIDEEVATQSRLLSNRYNADGTKRRNRKVTDAFKQKFIEELAKGPSVTAICGAMDISTNAIYLWRKKDPEFKEAWEDALVRKLDVFKDRLTELSLETKHPLATLAILRNLDPAGWHPQQQINIDRHETITYTHQLDTSAAKAIAENILEQITATGRTLPSVAVESVLPEEAQNS